jgi:hypothetical protein
MSWFLLLFLSIYGAMQAYVFWALVRAWRFRVRGKIALGIWLVLMLPGPIVVRVLDNEGYYRLAEAGALVFYSWMAVSFWLVVGFGLIDVYNTTVRGLGRLLDRLGKASIRPRWRAWTVTPLVLLALVAGLWEASHPRITHLEVTTPHLPADRDQIRIVLISDMHLGLHMGPGELDGIVARIKQLSPDMLISTGDLVDSSMHRLAGLAEPLSGISTPLGKYAVLGNHEYYVGLDASERFHRQAGFRLLRQQWTQPTEGLILAGVDDPAGRRRAAEVRLDEHSVLSQVPEGFVILLKHRPGVADASARRFDLQLSGHTHGGQIWPWHYITYLQFPYVQGLHRLRPGSSIYVHRGTGTWGPPIRLFAPPEITVITLRRAAEGAQRRVSLKD